MDPSFIPVEVVPSRTPFALDQLRRSYKTSLASEYAIAAAPAIGDGDEIFLAMFLVNLSTPESAESATRVDLLYMGNMGGPLPLAKHDESNSVQSVSASKYNTGATLASPATLQYYAPASVLTYFSFAAPGTTTAPTPSASPVPITLTISDTTFSSGGSIQATIDALFVLQVISTIESIEVVPGQYWQNVARTSLIYSPWIFDVASGPYISLYSPGDGYAPADSLTISSGGENATIIVDTVGSSWGGGTGLLSWHVTANTFTTSHNALMASGGSGSGAGFNVVIIP